MDKDNDSIGNTVRKMMTDAKVVAALSDQTPPTPDAEGVAHAYERLYRAFELALDRIHRLEIELAHCATLKWMN